MPGQCSGRRAPTDPPSQSSRKRPLCPQPNRVPQKHRKTNDDEDLDVVVAPHPEPRAIEHELGTLGTVTKLSGIEPLLLSASLLQERDELPYFGGVTFFSEYWSRKQRLPVVGHKLPQTSLDHAHIESQDTAPWYLGRYDNNKGLFDTTKDMRTADSSHLIDCLGEDSDKDVSVAAGDFNTYLASVTVLQATPPLYSERVVEAHSDNAIKLLSDAMSSTSIKDAHDVKSQAAKSEPKTLSSMSSIYGPKSLYQVKRRSSQCTKSSLPEMQTFDTTIDTMLCEKAQETVQNQHEALEFLMPRHFNKGEELMESAMSGHILLILDLLSDDRYGIDINHRSSAANGQTPLMLAIRRSGYVLREMLMWCITAQRWTLLSAFDNDGNTIIDLAASEGIEVSVARLIERIIAALCCECSDQARRASLCEWIAHTTPSERCGLELEGGPVRYPFRAGCRWGERLLGHGWLTAETLREIDSWMRDRVHKVNSSHRTRMVNELRDLYWEPNKWKLILRLE